MNTPFPSHPRAASPPQANPKYGIKHAVILMGLLVVGATVLALLYAGLKLLSAPRASVPNSHPVDAERFEARYGSWGTLTDFRAKQFNMKEGSWTFAATMETSSDADTNHLKWYIEVYQQGKLIDVIDTSLAPVAFDRLSETQQSEKEATARRGYNLMYLKSNQHFIHYGDKAKPYQFLSFVGRTGSQCTSVPITSVLASNSSGSAKPVAYERKLNIKNKAIELSDGKLETGRFEGDGNDDQIKFKMKVLDEEFLLQFDHSDVQRANYLYFVIENEYGSILRYTAVEPYRNFKHGKEMTLPAPRMTFNSWERNWLRRGPLKVYIIKMKARTAFRGSRLIGIGETLQVYSNVLIIEK